MISIRVLVILFIIGNIHGYKINDININGKIDEVVFLDFNNDSIKDLVVLNKEKRIFKSYIFNNKSLSLISTITISQDMPEISTLYKGFFNSDDLEDIVIIYEKKFIQVFTGIGNGKFNTSKSLIFRTRLIGDQVSSIGDFNGDGRLDILLTPYEIHSNRLKISLFTNINNNKVFKKSYQVLLLGDVIKKLKNNKSLIEIDGLKTVNINNDDSIDLMFIDIWHNRYFLLTSSNKKSKTSFNFFDYLDFGFKVYESTPVDINNDGIEEYLTVPTFSIQSNFTNVFSNMNKLKLIQKVKIGNAITFALVAKKKNSILLVTASESKTKKGITIRDLSNNKIGKKINYIYLKNGVSKLYVEDLNNDDTSEAIIIGDDSKLYIISL